MESWIHSSVEQLSVRTYYEIASPQFIRSSFNSVTWFNSVRISPSVNCIHLIFLGFDSIYVLCLFSNNIVTVLYPFNFAIDFVDGKKVHFSVVWLNFFSCSRNFFVWINWNSFACESFFCHRILRRLFIKGYQITRFLCGYKWVIVLWIARRAKIEVFLEFHIEINVLYYLCVWRKKNRKNPRYINQIVIEKQRVEEF